MAAPSVLAAFIGFCLFIVLTIIIFAKINEVQKKPYMDEIFHIPQAQLYCQGQFNKWDPMITTLPGLYILTSGLYNPISRVLYWDPLTLCSTYYLRGINVLFNFGNLYLLYKLSTKLHGREEATGVTSFVESMTLTSLPILYFHAFLYYTDQGGMFFVLLMYVFHLHDNNMAAAVIGVISVIFRQTNMVWVVFMAGLTLGKVLIHQLHMEKKEVNVEKLGDWAILKLTWKVIVFPALTSPGGLFSLVCTLLKALWMYVSVGCSFVAFIYVNKGIVVGDRSHHEACLHIPQLFYFLCFTTCLGFPYMISVHKVFDYVVSTAKRPLPMILFSGIAWFCVYKFTYVHEYLLADNRHYSFYIWSKIYRRHDFVKYALIPVYYYALIVFMQNLKRKDVFWKIAFFLCLSFATVPQKLLELRYFILPFVIFRLNMPSQPMYKLLMELSLYVVINALTLYLYIYQPFKWEHEEGWQRFLW